MVVATVAAVVVVTTCGAAAVAGAAVGATAGATGATSGTAAALGTAVGVGTSGGAIAGAATATSGTLGAVTGAVGGATSAAGVCASGTALGRFISGSDKGFFGLITLGAEENKSQLTFDCWKPVLHDSSSEPSQGMMIRDIVRHPNIASVVVETTDSSTLPHIIFENVWREKFEIQYFVIKDTGRLVAHANPVA